MLRLEECVINGQMIRQATNEHAPPHPLSADILYVDQWKFRQVGSYGTPQGCQISGAVVLKPPDDFIIRVARLRGGRLALSNDASLKGFGCLGLVFTRVFLVRVPGVSGSA